MMSMFGFATRQGTAVLPNVLDRHGETGERASNQLSLTLEGLGPCWVVIYDGTNDGAVM